TLYRSANAELDFLRAEIAAGASQFDDAKILFEKCLPVFAEAGQSGKLVIIHFHLGHFAHRRNDRLKAYFHFSQAEAISGATGNDSGRAEALMHLGDLATLENKYRH